MKAILLSIQPKWLKMILNGEKTIEIRKTIPKCELPIDVYLYCAKQGSKKDYFLVDHKIFNEEFLNKPCEKRFSAFPKNWDYDFFGDIANGKVVAKFTLNKVSFFDSNYEDFVASVGKDFPYSTAENWLSILKFEDLITKKGCLTVEELWSYFEEGKNDIGYAWHIDNLQIFDNPKELSDFFKSCGNCEKKGSSRCTEEISYCRSKRITKAPQSWQYVEVKQ